MFIKSGTLQGYKLNSFDGVIGSVDDIYFDDRHWTIRYLVANTGNWLTGRQVLISPYALGEAAVLTQQVAINLTKKQIEDSPSLDTDKPVSQQFELSFYEYYGWPTYWGGTYMWGNYPWIMRDPEQWKKTAREHKTWDLHLRSAREVKGYHIHAKDGEIGHISDFIIDDDTWAIRYLIVDTLNWWPGKKVLISPKWIDRVSWDESKVFVNLSRDTIKSSPEYIEDSLPTRTYEVGLHKHYNQKAYWDDEPAANERSSWRDHGEPKEGLGTF